MIFPTHTPNLMEIYRRKGELSSPEIAKNRQRLVEEFNLIVGVPGTQELKVQEEFIAEQMTEGRAASYIKFLQYMIATTKSDSQEVSKGFVQLPLSDDS